jgi:hypothetical protein
MAMISRLDESMYAITGDDYIDIDVNAVSRPLPFISKSIKTKKLTQCVAQ